jgi:hypothetical protein
MLREQRVTARELRRFVLGRTALAVGLVAALAGAGLATGLMAHGALTDGETYTTVSWALIGPVWGVLGVLWTLVRRWPVAAAVPMGGLAIFAGTYYGDVYGQLPAGLLFLLATALVFLPNEMNRTTAEMPTASPSVRDNRLPGVHGRGQLTRRRRAQPRQSDRTASHFA